MVAIRNSIACASCLLLSFSALAEFPGVLIDYTRFAAPHGVTRLPPALTALIPAPREDLALQWVLFEDRGRVKVRLIDSQPHDESARVTTRRSLTVHFDGVEEYRAVVGEHPALHINPEVITTLRERRREVGLSSQNEIADPHFASFPRILQDPAVKRQLPDGNEWFKFNLRALELQAEGKVRLSVSGVAKGEPFFTSVYFENLAEFNGVSGENVLPGDFARQVLPFWISPDRAGGPEPARGRYVMKTRREIEAQCADLLTHGVTVAPAP